MNLSEISLNDLKAKAYDAICLIEYNQSVLNAINSEIRKRNENGDIKAN